MTPRAGPTQDAGEADSGGEGAHVRGTGVVKDPARIEALVERLESLDPAARSTARELLEGVLELHRNGLERALEVIASHGAAGAALRDALARDPAVSALLLLHDLHPVAPAERARAAVDRARAELAIEGCTVELISVEDGIVRVRLERTSAGHRASADELRTSLRDAIWAEAPEAIEVRIEGQLAPGRDEAPLVQLRAAAGRP
jgi:hypothetical protein